MSVLGGLNGRGGRERGAVVVWLDLDLHFRQQRLLELLHYRANETLATLSRTGEASE